MANREERYLFDCLDSNSTFGELKRSGVNTLLQNIPTKKLIEKCKKIHLSLLVKN